MLAWGVVPHHAQRPGVRGENIATRGEKGPKQDLQRRRVFQEAAGEADRGVEDALADAVYVTRYTANAGQVGRREVGENFGGELEREAVEEGHGGWGRRLIAGGCVGCCEWYL